MVMAAGNTSSISVLCKKCKSKVNTGLKCIKCDSYFHPSCAKLKNVKIIDNLSVNCCESDDLNIDNAFFLAMRNLWNEDKKVDISIFQYIVKQKDMVIDELKDKIRILNNQIELLQTINNSVTSVSNVISEQKILEVSSRDKNVRDKRNERRPQKQTDSQENVNINRVPENTAFVTRNEVSAAIELAESERKMKNYINLTTDLASTSQSRKEEWNEVVKRKSNKRKIIIGNNKESNSIKTVPKYVVLHVYRLDPQTTVNQLSNLLQINFPEVKCEKLISRLSELYSSFKVTILEHNFAKAMDPNIWPDGACVSKFFMKRKVETQRL